MQYRTLFQAPDRNTQDLKWMCHKPPKENSITKRICLLPDIQVASPVSACFVPLFFLESKELHF